MTENKITNVLGYDLGVAQEDNGTITIVIVGKDVEDNNIATYLNADVDRMQQWVNLIQEYIDVTKRGQ